MKKRVAVIVMGRDMYSAGRNWLILPYSLPNWMHEMSQIAILPERDKNFLLCFDLWNEWLDVTFIKWLYGVKWERNPSQLPNKGHGGKITTVSSSNESLIKPQSLATSSPFQRSLK